MTARFSSFFFLPGFLFLLLNSVTAHYFYHVNSYKIVLLGICSTILFLSVSLKAWKSGQSADRIQFSTSSILLLLYPIVLSIPGAISQQLNFNYNFNYELVSFAFLFIWALFVFLSLRSLEDFDKIAFWFALVIIYSALWGILEYFGSHPLLSGYPSERIRSTFGHFNYYAGFLIITIPVIFVKALPSLFDKSLLLKERLKNFDHFYLSTFLLSLLALYFTQTRAAVFALVISVVLASVIFAFQFLEKKGRNTFLACLAGAGFIFFLSLILILSNIISIPEDWLRSRYFSIFTFNTWAGRISAWNAAVASIIDSPLFGYGLGSSYNLYFKYVSPDSRVYTHERSFNHAHSEILEFIQESGLFGFAFFVLFWVWFYKNLLRIMIKNDSVRFKYIAYAVFVGISSYHLHSIFSVAQRMIVVRFPMFTIAAIGIYLFQCASEKKSTLDQKLTSILNSKFTLVLTTSGIIILASWFTFYPWMRGQYIFAEVNRERTSYSNLRVLEELTTERQDVYALDYLAIQQLSYKRFDQLTETLKRLDQAIPNFRQIGFVKAYKTYFEGDLNKAKELARSYQQYDSYHKNNIELLMKIALHQDDYVSFKDGLRELLFYTIFQKIKIDLQKNPFEKYDTNVLVLKLGSQFSEAEEEPYKLNISFSDFFIQRIFNKLKTRLTEKDPNQSDVYSLVSNELTGIPYFTIKEPASNFDQQLVNQHLSKFFQLRNEMLSKEKELEEGVRRSYRVGMSKWKRGKLKYDAELDIKSMKESYQEKMLVHEEALMKKTDWKKFLQKRELAEEILRTFLEIESFITS